ncbi:hypothetical protein O181_097113 [Austropuccinia psidii MF-1]|uniref:Uncharacterized protein n=1 Tax=Austropuccinia psidii MF-1 TaxID=1389203 RepID=A0A9Q3J8A2_9BASI|nr:hypothetical protein [Austropuccinia psidii MF-1]
MANSYGGVIPEKGVTATATSQAGYDHTGDLQQSRFGLTIQTLASRLIQISSRSLVCHISKGVRPRIPIYSATYVVASAKVQHLVISQGLTAEGQYTEDLRQNIDFLNRIRHITHPKTESGSQGQISRQSSAIDFRRTAVSIKSCFSLVSVTL